MSHPGVVLLVVYRVQADVRQDLVKSQGCGLAVTEDSPVWWRQRVGLAQRPEPGSST